SLRRDVHQLREKLVEQFIQHHSSCPRSHSPARRMSSLVAAKYALLPAKGRTTSRASASLERSSSSVAVNPGTSDAFSRSSCMAMSAFSHCGESTSVRSKTDLAPT